MGSQVKVWLVDGDGVSHGDYVSFDKPTTGESAAQHYLIPCADLEALVRAFIEFASDLDKCPACCGNRAAARAFLAEHNLEVTP